MSETHKKQRTSVSEDEERYKKTLEEMADAVIGSLKPGYRSDLEPFEQYAEKVKAKMHTDMDDFRLRLAKGYKALLDEIQKNHSESTIHDSIKP